ncbi:cyclic nucleotide-binding protein, hydrogenase accessory protein [mine drainage metagenome]|uniref:Cyclic nucleotide-binding protein, hydrogenase accessory protein n=1 Tax=mine drainage metagenome TaxID=410659 RepID=T0Z971_9ZZZZ
MTDPTPAPPKRPQVGDHPFFHAFDPGFLRRLDAAASERTLLADEFLFHEGGPAQAFYLLREGKVALEIASPGGPPLTIQTIGPREVIGWSWLVPPHRWRFDARGLKATRLIAVDATTLRNAIDDRPDQGYLLLRHLVPVLAERLEMARLQVLDVHRR